MIAIAAALWFATIVRFAKWHQAPRMTPAVGTIVVLATLAALTTTNSRAFHALGIATPVVSAAQQLLLIAACVGAEIVVAGIAQPDRLARLLQGLLSRSGAVAAAVLALFALGPSVPGGLTIYQFAAGYAGNPYFGTAFLLVQLYSGVACARVAYFAGKVLRDEQLRIPMALLAAGAAVLTLYAVLRSASLIAALTTDFEPHLTIMFNVMSYVAAVGAVLLIGSFCWVPFSRLLQSARHLVRQSPIYCQITQFDPSLRADWKVGGFSLSRRADVHATAVLDFLTLLLPHDVSEGVASEPNPRRIASWLSVPGAAPARPDVVAGMLAAPRDMRPAEWLDQVLQHLPGGRAALLADLQEATMTSFPGQPRTPADVAARVITEVSAPWLVNTLAALYVGVVTRSLSWGALAAFIAGVGPILSIVVFMRLGKATDHHVSDRQHRALVVVMIVIFMVAGIGIELAGHAPAPILTLSVAGLVTIVAVGIVTTAFKYKISVHTAVWTGTSVLLAALVSPAWLCALLALPAVAWARIRVQDHTFGQTLTGAMLGVATVVLTLAGLP